MRKKNLIITIISVTFIIAIMIYLFTMQNMPTNVPKETRDKLNGEYICDGLKYVFNDKTVEAQTKLTSKMGNYPYYDINFDNGSISFKINAKIFVNTNLYFVEEHLSYKDLVSNVMYECQKIK